MQHCKPHEYSLTVAFDSIYAPETLTKKLDALYQETGAAGRFEIAAGRDANHSQRKTITFFRSIGEDTEYVANQFKPELFGGRNDEYGIKEAALSQIYDELFSSSDTKKQSRQILGSMAHGIFMAGQASDDEKYFVDDENIDKLNENVLEYMGMCHSHDLGAS